jgi:hypothetical protein
MTFSQELSDLRAEVRDLRWELSRLRDRPDNGKSKIIRLARTEGTADPQPVIFLDGGEGDRSTTSHATAKEVGDNIVVFENEGALFYFAPSGDGGGGGGQASDCLCSLITLLKAHDHLTDITDTEWDNLMNCGCADTEPCAQCIAGTETEDITATFSGLTHAFGFNPIGYSAADWAAVVNHFNGTHTMTQSSASGYCRWDSAVTVVTMPDNNEDWNCDVSLTRTYDGLGNTTTHTLSLFADTTDNPSTGSTTVTFKWTETPNSDNQVDCTVAKTNGTHDSSVYDTAVGGVEGASATAGFTPVT